MLWLDAAVVEISLESQLWKVVHFENPLHNEGTMKCASLNGNSSKDKSVKINEHITLGFKTTNQNVYALKTFHSIFLPFFKLD